MCVAFEIYKNGDDVNLYVLKVFILLYDVINYDICSCIQQIKSLSDIGFE